jgi:hypothetical protein
MKIYTLTNEYAVILINGEFIKADVEYVNNKPFVTINHESYFLNKLS